MKQEGVAHTGNMMDAGGLHYNMEMLREQARCTHTPQWVRVVGGWSEFQFKERRMPTLEKIEEATVESQGLNF
ncbi:hypothetical protein DN390_29265 [Bacillus sp. SH7-1]|nr:hypothetical protein [Bacillus sp. SH7-1]TXR91256.1 hypothetical protein DN390_29265 [Bacillus sp. SH7-1]